MRRAFVGAIHLSIDSTDCSTSLSSLTDERAQPTRDRRRTGESRDTAFSPSPPVCRFARRFFALAALSRSLARYS